ncbi:hypothetical protein [Pelomonas sp. KK5]|uniref:hypothetical protein n=1 Tax=Pelomonas sp. KK5 TaxID=1855730 RepID=UPI00097C0EAD|nr:hypothetical protein [Pelomonas sp. KK5]
MAIPPFPELFHAASSGVIGYDLLARLAAETSVPAPQMLDSFSIFVASAYASGEMPFDEASVIINAVFGVGLSEPFWAAHDRVVPPSMMEVYQAFDAGEYHHPGDGPEVDPEQKYTQPLIADFLARCGSNA